MLKRYAMWVVGLVMLAWLVQYPSSAAHLTRELGNAFGHILDMFARFLGGLLSGQAGPR